jgi:hypothetical protein
MTATMTAAKMDADELLNLLGATQSADFTERRSEVRHPFFAPVSLRSTTQPDRLLSTFSREISHGGIGLLHNMPIERGTTAEACITVGDVKTSKIAEAMWCKPAGEGWYLSGWRFVTTA